MRLSRRLVARAALTALAVSALAVAGAPVAAADSVDDAVTALRSSPLYVAPDATAKVSDTAGVQSALGSSIKVAILPSSVTLSNAGPRLQNSLSGQETLAVFAGTDYQAKSSRYCSSRVNDALGAAVADHRGQLNQDNDLTATLKQWASA
ncbi:MAG: hypothetical protein JO147_00935, partial [Actinobacteria bacterium]|nr:hypothetical protein [Actinomycetota bacterium]